MDLILLSLFALLSFYALRLRLELWANRRVIAALEQAGRQAQPKPAVKSSHLSSWLIWFLLLIVVGQLAIRVLAM